jgi:hypothetical protein
LKGTGVIQAENRHDVGIQRTQSWLVTKKLKIAHTAKRTRDQMLAYRYGKNTLSDGQKRDKEAVFKLKDELPDAVRYALMAFPELPDPDSEPMTDAEAARWAAFDDKTRRELEIQAERRKKLTGGVDLQPHEEGYPGGNVFQNNVEDFGLGGW